MDLETSTHFISIDELLLAFKTLPTNTDDRLQFITLPIPLKNKVGQIHKYPLQFDWNTSSHDWELSHGQPITITAGNRLCELQTSG